MAFPFVVVRDLLNGSKVAKNIDKSKRIVCSESLINDPIIDTCDTRLYFSQEIQDPFD